MCMCIQEGLQGVSLVPRPSLWIVKVGGVANVETATGEGVTGAGRKAEAKREGLVNGLYISWTSTPEFRRTFLRVLIKVLCVTVATVCNT